MELQKQEKKLNHIITIDNNQKAIITGVVEVISSTDKAVVARTDISTFQLLGENLRVSKLVLEEKLCHVEGNIYKLEYNKSVQKKNIIKRLFK